MKYLCLIYNQEKNLAALSKAEWNSLMEEFFAFTDGLRSSGHYLDDGGLQPTATATTVRVRDGRISATDGPFAETSEQLGGYYLIEAADLNEAIQIAARIPSAKLGAIEVRPVQEHDM
jgi:hypothetical protein